MEENAPMALDEVPTNVRRKIPNLLRMQVLYDRDSLSGGYDCYAVWLNAFGYEYEDSLWVTLV